MLSRQMGSVSLATPWWIKLLFVVMLALLIALAVLTWPKDAANGGDLGRANAHLRSALPEQAHAADDKAEYEHPEQQE